VGKNLARKKKVAAGVKKRGKECIAKGYPLRGGKKKGRPQVTKKRQGTYPQRGCPAYQKKKNRKEDFDSGKGGPRNQKKKRNPIHERRRHMQKKKKKGRRVSIRRKKKKKYELPGGGEGKNGEEKKKKKSMSHERKRLRNKESRQKTQTFWAANQERIKQGGSSLIPVAAFLSFQKENMTLQKEKKKKKNRPEREEVALRPVGVGRAKRGDQKEKKRPPEKGETHITFTVGC